MAGYHGQAEFPLVFTGLSVAEGWNNFLSCNVLPGRFYRSLHEHEKKQRFIDVHTAIRLINTYLNHVDLMYSRKKMAVQG